MTAFKEIVRQRLSNGVTNDSVEPDRHHQDVDRIGVAQPARDRGQRDRRVSHARRLNPNWQTVSLSYYNSRLRNYATGAKELKLPLTMVGGSNPDLVMRPAVGEDTANSVLFGERLYSKASLRILLSDTAADISNLPTIDTTKPPVSLDGNWNMRAAPMRGTAIAAAKPPVALSPGTITATTMRQLGATIVNFAQR